MNAALALPEILIGPQPADSPELPLSTEGVQRYVWNGAFGAMLIEVKDGSVFVNTQRVVPMAELRASESEP
jgi:hypothetical protein